MESGQRAWANAQLGGGSAPGIPAADESSGGSNPNPFARPNAGASSCAPSGMQQAAPASGKVSAASVKEAKKAAKEAAKEVKAAKKAESKKQSGAKAGGNEEFASVFGGADADNPFCGNRHLQSGK